jgi:hypothetical protein
VQPERRADTAETCRWRNVRTRQPPWATSRHWVPRGANASPATRNRSRTRGRLRGHSVGVAHRAAVVARQTTPVGHWLQLHGEQAARALGTARQGLPPMRRRLRVIGHDRGRNGPADPTAPRQPLVRRERPCGWRCALDARFWFLRKLMEVGAVRVHTGDRRIAFPVVHVPLRCRDPLEQGIR